MRVSQDEATLWRTAALKMRTADVDTLQVELGDRLPPRQRNHRIEVAVTHRNATHSSKGPGRYQSCHQAESNEEVGTSCIYQRRPNVNDNNCVLIVDARI